MNRAYLTGSALLVVLAQHSQILLGSSSLVSANLYCVGHKMTVPVALPSAATSCLKQLADPSRDRSDKQQLRCREPTPFLVKIELLAFKRKCSRGPNFKQKRHRGTWLRASPSHQFLACQKRCLMTDEYQRAINVRNSFRWLLVTGPQPATETAFKELMYYWPGFCFWALQRAFQRFVGFLCYLLYNIRRFGALFCACFTVLLQMATIRRLSSALFVPSWTWSRSTSWLFSQVVNLLPGHPDW